MICLGYGVLMHLVLKDKRLESRSGQGLTGYTFGQIEIASSRVTFKLSSFSSYSIWKACTKSGVSLNYFVVLCCCKSLVMLMVLSRSSCQVAIREPLDSTLGIALSTLTSIRLLRLALLTSLIIGELTDYTGSFYRFLAYTTSNQ